MEIKLKWPFEHEGTRYESIKVPDYIQVGHRRIYAKSKDLEKEDAGITLCAALCEIPEAAFDRLSLDDFEKLTGAVRDLFNSAGQKKQKSQPKKETSRGS
ncbi:MAG TPA: phage tail assembly protein [Oligoflexus sp.]|uniref:phage tail assembly protein n=1 Tax=Oligoflexus sp. TaxID=1971216 RepID=UPI002D5538F7|nr:phage tail assembly protein [Oligoflexus sp.]HYX37274.1 phage tail assembly protein [Oligoflexus sp.]